MSFEWNDRIRSIARNWLFGDFPAAERFPETVILPLENPDLHDHESFMTQLGGRLKHLTSISIGRKNGVTVGVMRSKLGGPAVALATECLAMMGVRRIIGVGYCGSLKKTCTAGSILVPTHCYTDDHLPLRYGADASGIRSDSTLSEQLYHQLQQQAVNPIRAALWSTDAIMLETSEAINRWASTGALGVDMECATLFQVAGMRNMASSAIVVASDNAVTGEPANNGVLANARDAAIEAAFAVAKTAP
ncbi:hypothetical protein [Marinimicrobium agarilyticum]|uniref:phosphorylase family protein n=1 Tax=Marinimicrobium agarilyticum TaxID=306546 RepID=UPI00048A20D4|nr:hypothetical protein [Marinimicrobium agarilyticum]